MKMFLHQNAALPLLEVPRNDSPALLFGLISYSAPVLLVSRDFNIVTVGSSITVPQQQSDMKIEKKKKGKRY